MGKNFSVIDFHVHLADYISYRESAYKWLAQAFESEQEYEKFRVMNSNPDNFCETLKQHGVDYAVILAEVAPLTTGIATNELVENFCADKKELIPFCTLNPYNDPDLSSSLEDLYNNHGFKGVKLYPTYNYFYPNDAKLYPLYATAEKLGIPILFHTGSSVFKGSRIKYGNPIFFDDVAVDFPDLTILMAHGGRMIWFDEAMMMTRLHQNVYIEISGLPPQKLLEYFPTMERFADKFVFGSDWPSVNTKKNIEIINNLNISNESKEMILGRNAKRILGIK